MTFLILGLIAFLLLRAPLYVFVFSFHDDPPLNSDKAAARKESSLETCSKYRCFSNREDVPSATNEWDCH